MSSQEYLNKMKVIQESILNFLEEGAKSEENLIIFKDNYNNLKISDSKYDILTLLHLISEIGNNCHRFPNFFDKIEKILQFFKEDIKKYFPNSKIFNIFKSNKRILLFLIEQQIIIIDEYIVKEITKTDKYINAKYPQYFQPEIQPFINRLWLPRYLAEELNEELPENFYEKRKEGENDNLISEMIRKDMIAEFVAYVTRNEISLDAKIQPSIYETNSFLLEKQTESNQNQSLTLIEYAAFFGSIKILKYLQYKDVKLTQSLLPLAIHSQNVQMIRFLEENHVELEDKLYKQVFYESIKCHDNDIANYILSNFLQNDEENSRDVINQSLKYYNFAFLKNESISKFPFRNLYKYEYYVLFYNFLNDMSQNAIFNILLIQSQLKII
ncbi:hypothetical protein M9Y10_011797 [Tritrichomonas musculus]|uniref:DUF3447 domain-containing protein n=1 Tax=Tritrichomonas musculus TaxID=1915356 RepID=A0ABR2IKB8_9EUKA